MVTRREKKKEANKDKMVGCRDGGRTMKAERSRGKRWKGENGGKLHKKSGHTNSCKFSPKIRADPPLHEERSRKLEIKSLKSKG